MSGDDDDSLDSLDCDPLVMASGSQVAIWRSVRDQLDGLEVKQQGRFERIMVMWCEGHKLPEQMINRNEGRSKGGIRLEAFKAFKIRLYGFVRSVKQVSTFIIVDVDPAKKQDKADPAILKRAKGRVDQLKRNK